MRNNRISSHNWVGLFSIVAVVFVAFFASLLRFCKLPTYQATAESDVVDRLANMQVGAYDGRAYLRSDWFDDFRQNHSSFNDEEYYRGLTKSQVKELYFIKGYIGDYFSDYWQSSRPLIQMEMLESDSQYSPSSVHATYTLDELGYASVYVIDGYALTAPENSDSLFAGFDNLEVLYLETLVTDKTVDMSFMFANNSNLTQLYIPNLDTSLVDNMTAMFSGDSSLNTVDWALFDTSNAVDMTQMFFGCETLENVDLTTWNTSNVESMASMFEGCSSVAKFDLAGLNTSKVYDMAWMFKNCSNATYFNFGGWDTTSVERFAGMFLGCSSLKSLDLRSFDMQKATDFLNFFEGATAIERLGVPHNVVRGTIQITSTEKLIKADGSSSKVIVSQIDSTTCSNDSQELVLVSGVAISIFDGSEEGVDFHSVVNNSTNFTSGLILKNPVEITLSYVEKEGYKFVGWDLEAIYSSNSIGKAPTVEISDVDGQQVLHVESIFYYADIVVTARFAKVEGFLPRNLLFGWESPITDYEQCIRLEEVYFLYQLPENINPEDCDVCSIGQSNITDGLPARESVAEVVAYFADRDDYGYYSKLYVVCPYEMYAPLDSSNMFNGLSNLQKIVFENFNTKYVENMNSMFESCTSIEWLDLSNFDTSSVGTMNYMFSNCSSLVGVEFNGWDTSNVVYMMDFFNGCSNLSFAFMQDFDLSNCQDVQGVFAGCDSLAAICLPYKMNDNYAVDVSFKYFVNWAEMILPDVDISVPDYELMPEHVAVVSSFDGSMCNGDKYENVKTLYAIVLIKIYLDGEYVGGVEGLISNRWYAEAMDYPLTENRIEFSMTELFGIDVDVLSCNADLLTSGNVYTEDDNFCIEFNSSGFVELDIHIPYNSAQVLSQEWDDLLHVSRDRIKDFYILSGDPETYGVNSGGCFHVSEAYGYDENGEEIIPNDAGALLGYVEYYDDEDGYRWATVYVFAPINIYAPIDSSRLFMDCINIKTIDLRSLDTSYTQDMSQMFYGAENLRQIDVSGFDTSMVENMSAMFANCKSFTQLNLDNFNTENVTNMSGMFSNCSSLTELDLSNFDTSKVTDMTEMFAFCSDLTNLDISNFNTKNVETMSLMFAMSGFAELDLSGFDTSSLHDVSGMFYGMSNLKRVDWEEKVENVTSMYAMFTQCTSLQEINLANFNMQNVRSMISMFEGCTALESATFGYGYTEALMDMEDIFKGCVNLRFVNLEMFDLSKVSFCEWIFTDCDRLLEICLPIEMGDNYIVVGDYFINRLTYKYVTEINKETCARYEDESPVVLVRSLAVDVCINGIDLDVEYIISFYDEQRYHLAGLIDFDDFDDVKVEIDDSECVGLLSQEGEDLIVSAYAYGVAKINFVFENVDVFLAQNWFDIIESEANNKGKSISRENVVEIYFIDNNKWPTQLPEVVLWEGIVDADNLDEDESIFKVCAQVRELKAGQVVIYIYSEFGGTICAPGSSSELFRGFSNLKTIVFENFDTQYAESMDSMFESCLAIELLDLSSFNTSSVVSMDGMFLNCSSLVSIECLGWDTSNVVKMQSVFSGCNIEEIDLSGWDFSKVENMNSMFENCIALESVNWGNCVTTNLNSMDGMFAFCESLTEVDLSEFDIGNLDMIEALFQGCVALEGVDVSTWDTSKVESMARMFSGCKSLTVLNVSNFDTSNLVDMDSMFADCDKLEYIDLSNWDMSNVTSMRYSFLDCDNLRVVYFGKTTQTAYIEKYTEMFADCEKLEIVDLSWIDLSNSNEESSSPFRGSNNLRMLILPRNIPEGKQFMLSEGHSLYFSATKEYAGESIVRGQESQSAENPTVLVCRSNLMVDCGYGDLVENRYYYFSMTAQTIDLVSPTRDGFVFAGWQFVSGNAVLENSLLTIEAENVEDVVVKALWTEVFTVDLSFAGVDSKGKPIKGTPTIEIESFNKLNGETLGDLPEPELKGYSFAGWYLDKDCTVVATADIVISADMVIYAKWIKDPIGWALYLGLAVLALFVLLLATLVVFDGKKSRHKKLLDHEKSLFAKIMEILTGKRWRKR